MLLAFIIAIIGVILFSVYTSKLKDIIDREAKITLENVSAQNVINLKNVISSKQKLLNTIALSIGKGKKISNEEIIERLKLYKETDEFYHMGITGRDGICYTTRDKKADISQYEYFINGMNGISSISNSYISKDKSVVFNIFAVPVYREDEVDMLLTAAYKSSDFSKILNVSSFDGEGQSIVVDSKGTLVYELNNSEEGYFNANKNNYILQAMSTATNEDKDNFINYQYDGNEYLAYYEELGINDWYLISYVPKNYLYSNINILSKNIYIGSLIVYSVIILVLVILFIERSKYEKKILSILFIDDLTNEKNYEYLKVYFENMSENEKESKSLIVMDIDKFKVINIMHGSKVGDSLLKYIPLIFKELLPTDEIFRYQGDTFVAIINSTSREDIIKKIDKIEKRIKEDTDKKLIVPIRLSFGVCAFAEFNDLHSIYNNALISKNEIKGSVRKNINFFSQENKNSIIEKRKIETKFIEALRNNEFEVWYQPKYNMKTNEICGAEALIRWRDKSGQFISPAKFIPVLENSGQIVKLDEAVIEIVFKNIQEMKRLGVEIKPVSINLSRVHVDNLGIVNKIKKLLENYKINPSYISFEFTESVLIEYSEALNKIIFQLHEIGFKVDMDDYGTGSSTLKSLSYSDFDTLKLDKSFIDYIGNPKMNSIIKSTINMAKELDMQVIAEGVESIEQVNFLIKNNCDFAQGYYYSKPIDKNEYLSLLKENKIDFDRRI